jgi:CHASE2 domain-containing sensor protein
VILFGPGEPFGPAVTAFARHLLPIDLWGAVLLLCAATQLVGVVFGWRPLRLVAAAVTVCFAAVLAVGFAVRDPWHIFAPPVVVIGFAQFHILTRLHVDRGRDVARRRRSSDA